MRPAIVMPMHDPDGVLFPHLKCVSGLLKQKFARGYLNVTAVTLQRQPAWVAWLDAEPFFSVTGGGDATRPGDQFAALYRHAAAVCPPDQVLQLGFVDRVCYALGSNHAQTYLEDVSDIAMSQTPLLYHRSAAAWATHPDKYRLMEGLVTVAGEALLGRSLDFAWCYMAITAERLGRLMPAVTRSDMSMLAEMVLGLRDELYVREVDWLAWEDPFLLGRDAAELKREREMSADEVRKRLGYVIPMLQVLVAHDGSKT
jgi:hypothetical protein